jgi:hypothetical protein
VPPELPLDVLEVGSDRLEDLGESERGILHNGSSSDANDLTTSSQGCQRNTEPNS